MADNGADTVQSIQSSSTQPPGFALPGLEQANESALDMFNRGVGTERYPGSLVIPYSQQTARGMNTIEGFANQANPALQDQFGRVQQNAEYGGLNPLQQQSVARLDPMARGDYLRENNPYTDAVVNRTADIMGNQVNEAFSADGRYGSGSHTRALADSVGGMANQQYQADYNRERGYMQDAIGSQYNAGQQQQGNINAAPGNLANAFSAANAPANALMDVGGRYEDLQQRLKADELRLLEQGGQADWDNVSRLMAIAGGAGQFPQTQQTVMGPSQSGGFQGAAGGAIAGAGLGLGLPGVIGGGLLGLLR